jgi:1-deoxy-D-xylulose-5-phosphate synthase
LKDNGYACSLVNARFVKPFDTDMLDDLAKDHKLFVTIEEATISGGYGEHVAKYVLDKQMDVNVQVHGVPDIYVEHGSITKLRETIQLDAKSIADKVMLARKEM